MLGLLLTDGESVFDALVSSDNTLGFLITLDFSVLLGFKVTVGDAVEIALGFDDTVGTRVFTRFLGLLLTDGKSVFDAVVSSDNTLGFIEALGFSVLLGFKLIVGDAVEIALGFEFTAGV